LQTAIDLRTIAVVLMDQDAKQLLKDLADDCELMAQKAGQMLDDWTDIN
jgi:hypothetical protein